MRSVLLVHGAWHGAWCFAALQADLERRGVPSYALDLPGHGTSGGPIGDLYAHAGAVVDALGTIPGEVVLVGHSWGGAVITEAASRLVAAGEHNVGHLVYLAAMLPDEGRSVLETLGSHPPQESDLETLVLGREDGTSVVDPAVASRALYEFCPPAVAAAAVARLGPHNMASSVQPVSGAPWRVLPSTYLHCLRDRTIASGHQARMAERCASVVTLDTDHSPFLSRTVETADLLEKIVRS